MTIGREKGTETVNITQVEVCSPRDIINLSFKG